MPNTRTLGRGRGIRGLGGAGRIFRDPTQRTPRACILVKGIEASLIPSQCSGDLTTIRIRAPMGEGSEREIAVASGYFPYDSQEEPPPEEVQKLIEYCNSRNLPLIMGCDANAHHMIWGSSDNNSRGNALLQYLVTTNLCVLNKGREPTFYNSIRSEVIDLTLCTNGIENWISGWRVLPEPSLSDHRYISFAWKEGRGGCLAFRNPRRTDWGGYKEELNKLLHNFKPDFGTEDRLDHWAERLSGIVEAAFRRNCPLTTTKGPQRPRWWSKELENLRRETRRTFNRAKNTRKPEDWSTHRAIQNHYKKKVDESRAKGWRNYCEDIENYPDAARLLRILSKNP